MHLFGHVLTFIAGAIVGGLIYRNNAVKAKVQMDKIVKLYEDGSELAKVELAEELAKLKK